jgi:hypothetical protein
VQGRPGWSLPQQQQPQSGLSSPTHAVCLRRVRSARARTLADARRQGGARGAPHRHCERQRRAWVAGVVKRSARHRRGGAAHGEHPGLLGGILGHEHPRAADKGARAVDGGLKGDGIHGGHGREVNGGVAGASGGVDPDGHGSSDGKCGLDRVWSREMVQKGGTGSRAMEIAQAAQSSHKACKPAPAKAPPHPATPPPCSPSHHGKCQSSGWCQRGTRPSP